MQIRLPQCSVLTAEHVAVLIAHVCALSGAVAPPHSVCCRAHPELLGVCRDPPTGVRSRGKRGCALTLLVRARGFSRRCFQAKDPSQRLAWECLPSRG
ncbi:hypothetical protein NDU88_004733 [Pleurodeles waltl]|uniref:Secreted protein n=1 Tax=Pleurodeles waltl TaxID=8319 RepID=A0AAV7WAL2_PLEWA|nr:hypothetical protein NDU88_004733 [Pleurodeles waltl]